MSFAFADRPSKRLRHIDADGNEDTLDDASDTYFFLFDAHKQLRGTLQLPRAAHFSQPVSNVDGGRADAEFEDAVTTKGPEADAATKPRPPAGVMRSISETLFAARSELDPVFDVLQGLTPQVVMISIAFSFESRAWS